MRTQHQEHALKDFFVSFLSLSSMAAHGNGVMKREPHPAQKKQEIWKKGTIKKFMHFCCIIFANVAASYSISFIFFGSLLRECFAIQPALTSFDQSTCS
jgi:hypothetical protein